MRINWKIKSLVFKLIDFYNIPIFLYFLQRFLTKRSQLKNFVIDSNWKLHKDILVNNNCTDFILEFGAGKNLAQNLYLSKYISKQLIVDLNPMIDISLVNKAKKKIYDKIGLNTDINIIKINDLLKYGITYKAPFDVQNSELKDKSINACVTTATLEHIPKENLINIIKELNRILKDDGVLSMIIDYSDHYAHTDNSISLLNYLKYTELEWKYFNHKCHFQNRLRHYDYVKIFEDCSFKIVSEDIDYKEHNIDKNLKKSFKDKHITWSATSSHIVAKKIV